MKDDIKVKGCISYPGGKSRVVKKILSPLFPDFSGDFYDPFIGGGSIPLWISQLYPNKKIIVNDINEKLFIFWNQLKNNHEEMVDKLLMIRKEFDPDDIERGKELLMERNEILYNKKSTELEQAVSYFVLNKISFSGMTEHGSLSKSNYKKKFNSLNIKKLPNISELMKNFEIFNDDYEMLINGHSRNDFIFLDPPYNIERNTLYGKQGRDHEGFDHERFAKIVSNIKCKFMLTYNDSEQNRENFKDYKIIDQEYIYYMVFKQDQKGNKSSRKKNELIITNY